MKKIKKHIDQLFSDNLKDFPLEIPKEELKDMFDAVKTDTIDQLAKTSFENFELEVDSAMWANVQSQTKKRRNKLSSIFSKFKIEPSPADWLRLNSALKWLRFKEQLHWFFKYFIISILVSIALNLGNHFTQPTENSAINNSASSKNNHSNQDLELLDSQHNNTTTQKKYYGAVPKNPSFFYPEKMYEKLSDAVKIKLTNLFLIKIESKKIGEFFSVNDLEKLKNDYLSMNIQEKQIHPFIQFHNPKNIFSLSVHHTTAQGQSILKTENDFYKNIRQNSNRPFMVNNLGISLAAQIGQFQISLGSDHEKRNYQFEYNHTVKIYDSIPVKDPNEEIIGYFYINHRDSTYNHNEYFHQTIFRIPLHISYTIPINTRWNCHLGANLNYENFKKSTSQLFLNPTNGWLQVNQNNPIIERNHVLSTGLNTGVSLKINSKIAAQTSLLMHRQISNKFITQDYQEFPYIWGVNFKLNYKL